MYSYPTGEKTYQTVCICSQQLNRSQEYVLNFSYGCLGEAEHAQLDFLYIL